MPYLSFAESTIEIPQTGQIVSYAGGDDGEMRQGVASPNSRFIDNGDGTVIDTLTGLMWIKKRKLGW